MFRPHTIRYNKRHRNTSLLLCIAATSLLFLAMRCERDVECPAFDETWDLYNYTVNPRKLTELDFTNVVTGEFVSLSTEESSSNSELFTCTSYCPCTPSNYQMVSNNQFDIRSNTFQLIDFGSHGSNIESKFMRISFTKDKYDSTSRADYYVNINQYDKARSNFSLDPKNHVINDTITITKSFLLPANYVSVIDSILIQYQQGLVAFWVGDTLWMRDDI